MGRVIRPSPGNPVQPPSSNKATIPTSGIPPFDAEEYFKNYDHEAVWDLSSRTMITPACYNRKETVKHCVGATNRYKLGAKVYIHDDGSDEYDVEWLSQFGDRVFRHPRSEGGRKGVKNIRSNITKSVLGEFEPDIFLEWIKQDYGTDGPEYLYHVDSDGYHAPHFFYRIHEIMNLYPNWGVICLYNAKFHSPRRNKSENNVINYHTVVRGMSAGISMFFRVESFRKNPKYVQVPDGRGWDGFYSQTIGNRRVVTSLVSYVEHFGKWGFHNKGSFDRDRALNPTSYLASIRGDVIRDIEEQFHLTQNESKVLEK